MGSRFSIHPPLAGIVRSSGRQVQPPYSCTESSNFWPVNISDGSALIATRSPMGTITFPDYPVNMLAQLNLPAPTTYVASNGVLYKRNNTTGVYAAITSSVGITTGRAVFAAPFFRQLLIANSGTPLHYDDDAGTMVSLVATTGFVPDDCRLAMNFQSRAWLGGSLSDPLGAHVFAGCRKDDLHDWDYSQDDVEAAYISTGENRGLITSPLTNMTAITEDQAILGCQEEVWSLSGDPRENGRFARVSNQTGILGQNACASTPRGFFFLSHDGLMSMARSDIGNLSVTPISRTKIPSELLNIEFDIENPTVAMAYSSRWNAIWLTIRDADEPQSWAYFLDSGGFYEQPLTGDNPFVMFPFESLVSEDKCGVLFGGAALKQFDRTATESITSSIIAGPVAISSSPLEANIVNQAAVLFGSGTTDDAASVELYTGPTGQTAIDRAEIRTAQYQYADDIGTIRANNRNIYPMLRGCYTALRLDQTASTNRVVFEDLVGNLIKGGNNVDDGQTAPLLTPPSIPLLEIDVG